MGVLSTEPVFSHTTIPEVRKWRWRAQVLWPLQGESFTAIQAFLHTRMSQCLKGSPLEQTHRFNPEPGAFQSAPHPYEGQVWSVEAHLRRQCMMSDEEESFGLDMEEMSYHLQSMEAHCMVLFTAAGTERSFNSAGRRGYLGWHLPDDLSPQHAKGHQGALWQHLGESSLHLSAATYEAFLSEGEDLMPPECMLQVQAACLATDTLKLVLPSTQAWLREKHLQAVWADASDPALGERSRL